MVSRLHSCQNCGCACYCGGDIDDSDVGDHCRIGCGCQEDDYDDGSALDAIVDTVLAYRPKARSKPSIQRKRRKTILDKKRAAEQK